MYFFEELGNKYSSYSVALLSIARYTATKIPFMHSQKRNCVASVPISTFTCLWAVHTFPGPVHIFSCSRIGRPILGYVNRSQTHECGNLTKAAQLLFWEFSVLSLCSEGPWFGSRSWRDSSPNTRFKDNGRSSLLLPTVIVFFTFCCRARMCWLFLCLRHPWMIFEGCLNSNSECCLSKRAHYQLSHPSPSESYILYLNTRNFALSAPESIEW